MTIESKQQSRLWHAFLAQEIAVFSYFEIRVPLNGAHGLDHEENVTASETRWQKRFDRIQYQS
jgi:hypothetical protein